MLGAPPPTGASTRMIRRLSTLAAAAALALVPLAASAQITAGTTLSGTIDQNIDSKSAVVGQRFTMSNVHSQDNKINTLNEAGGAVAGMIVGNIIGKKLGTNAGGLVGAAGGYLYAKNAKQNVTIPANTPVTVQVLRARRQATR